MQNANATLIEVGARLTGVALFLATGAVIAKVQERKNLKKENIIVLKKKHFTVAK